MKKRNYLLINALIIVMAACTSVPQPPVAEKNPKRLSMHGHNRVDDYFWMNERGTEKVENYLNAENAYTKSVLKHTESFQEKLFQEMKGRIKETDESVPYKKNGYYYYTRYEEGKEYPIYCRKRESMDNDEEIMLDVNVMAEGYSYFQISGVRVSPDNKIVSYGVDTVSRRKYTLYFKNLETGEIFSDKIPVTSGYAVWANDNKTVFYSRKDEVTLRTDKIYKHVLAQDVEKDQEIFYEEDETFYATVYKTKSDKFIVIGSTSTLTTEYRFIDAAKPNSEFKIIQPRERGLEYYVSHYGDDFYIVTNWEAQNFRLMKTRVGKTAKENWEEVIAHRPEVYLEGIEIFNKRLVVSERENGLNKIRIINWEDNSEHFLPFDEETYTAYVAYNPDFESDLLRFGYESLTTPSSTFDYNMATKEKELLKQREVLGDFDPANYESKRVWATADDGTKIPMSMVYRKGMEMNGQNPTLLYGYGSYGATMDPYFSSSRFSLLDRGFVYVIAHVRGSQYLGRAWYEDGKLLKKKNTFTDFNDCAEFLINEKYTNPDKLFAMGGSAGGLLMGAIINMQPELYKGIVAGVPFVDVISTMIDESIPLTTGEYDEWGNPKDKEYYDYMFSYSPYDQVTAQEYPNMLVTAGYHDSQVQYWEPAKWVAKLRELKTDDNLLLLHTNMEAGHGGASGRFEALKEVALEYAFILDLAGINE